MDNRCLFCYAIIPEGRQVCPRCMNYYLQNRLEPALPPDEQKKERSATMTKEDIIRKLTSRKFWAAIVGFVTGLLIYLGKSEAETEQIGALIMSAASVVAYIVGEGLIDAAREKGDTYIFPDEDTHPPEE
jgi:hypothetical protein